MTTVGVVRQPQRGLVHLFADGASTKADGSAGPPVTKIWTLTRSGCAIAMRGPMALIPTTAHYFDLVGGSFEEIRSNAGAALRELATFLPSLPPPFNKSIEVYVIGHNECGPDSFVISNTSNVYGPAFEPVELGDSAFAPGDPAINRTLPANYQSTDDLDIESFALGVGEIWRWSTYSQTDAPETAMVFGEHLQLVSIDRAGSITSKILRRYGNAVAVLRRFKIPA